jgi:hypothetical protein
MIRHTFNFSWCFDYSLEHLIRVPASESFDVVLLVVLLVFNSLLHSTLVLIFSGSVKAGNKLTTSVVVSLSRWLLL